MASTKDRIPSGIEKLDHLMGGFPKGRTILVTGDAGTGKTIFGLQFANSCCKAGLRTVHIATEECVEDLKAQSLSFGWDWQQNLKDGNMSFIELALARFQDIEAAMTINIAVNKGNFETLINALPKGTQVVIIDSLGSHTSELTPRGFKDRLDLLVHQLNEKNITTMLMLDSATAREYNDLALFSVYGAIIMMKRENPYTGRRERVMDIVKMRNTMTPIQLLTFDITPHGITITTSDEGDFGPDTSGMGLLHAKKH
jgi:KaiC/GvpD/RAD55 family RecA-like ATPase